METKTHWKLLTSPNYLGSYAFQPGEEKIVTIKEVKLETVTDPNGKVFVRKDSEAYRQGVRTGDYLIEINGTPISDLCTYLLMEHKHEETSFKFCSKNGIVKLITLRTLK